jgi:hypothetical protein
MMQSKSGYWGRAAAVAAFAAATAIGSAAYGASDTCRPLEVHDVISTCTGINGCPPGEYIYSVVLRNKTNRRLYVAYRFRDPNNRLTLGGLDIAPDSAIERPVGFGRSGIVRDEPGATRRGRFRPDKCGFTEKTKFSWQ